MNIIARQDLRHHIFVWIHANEALVASTCLSVSATFFSRFDSINTVTAADSIMSRTIAAVYPATHNGPLTRLIGTVDIDGKGTHHSLDQVDPFILLDKAMIQKNHFPPFGAHPHAGHSVVTLLLQGQIQSWDSVTNETTTITAPAAYWVDAGTGLFHDERSSIDDENDPAKHAHVLQLWIGVRREDRLGAPRVQYEPNLPVVELVSHDDATGSQQSIGTIIHFVGGPTNTIQTPHPIHVALIHQLPNTTYRHSIRPVHDGFVVNLNANDVAEQASFGGTRPSLSDDVLVLADTKDASYLEIVTGDDAAADYLVATGDCHHEPWVKLLAASGAIIAKNAEEARAMAERMVVAATNGKAHGSFAPFGI